MKILVIANFPPYVLGGAENQVARLVDAWLNMGHHVEVAGFALPNGQIMRGKHSITLHNISVFRRLGRLGTAFTYFLSLLGILIKRGKEFDIVYCRGLGDAVLSICLAKEIGVCNLPLVACPINAKGKGDANFIQSIPGSRYLVRLINRRCNAINIIAKDIKQDIKKIGINIECIKEIPNGIPILPHVRHSTQKKTIRIIFTGRLNHQKGLDMLILSLAKLESEKLKFQCTIVGEGPLYNQLSNQINELSLSTCVLLVGPVPSENIREKLLHSDIFILPSRYEGMSNSVLEAMESGLPILTTRCGGIDYYINKQNGWVCNPGNQRALTECLRKAITTQPHILEKMGLANRKLVENNFSIERIAAKNIEMFEQVLASS